MAEDNRSGFVRIMNLIMTLLLMAVLGILSYANIFHFAAHMDSDVASEAILAREIAKNNLRPPDTWVISTEVRYIYPANLAAPVYMLTHNLQLSMGIAATLCGLFLVVCMFFFYRKAGLSKGGLMLALLIPFVASANLHDYLEMFFMYAGYYFPVLAAIYITLFFYEEIIRQKNFLFYVISFLIAAVLGAQGMRGVLMVYLPILSAHAVKMIVRLCKKISLSKRDLIVALWLFAQTLLSAIVCRLTSAGVSDTSRNIRHGFEKLFTEVLPSVAALFAGGAGTVHSALGAVLCLTGLVISVYLLFIDRTFDSDIRWTALASLWAGAFVMIFAMAFTTFEVAPRYSLYIFFAAGCGIGMLADRAGSEESAGNPVKSTLPKFRPVLIFIYAAAFICGILFCTWGVNNLILKDGSERSSYVEIEEWMQKRGVDTGYAVFDFASDMTVVCNGRVNIYPVSSLREMEGCKWLSNAVWYPPTASADRKVLVMTTDHTDKDFEEFMAGDSSAVVTDSTRISDFNCYILENDPVLWTR